MTHWLSVETVGKTLRSPTCSSGKTPVRLQGIRAWFRRMVALSAAGLPPHCTVIQPSVEPCERMLLPIFQRPSINNTSSRKYGRPHIERHLP
jgi:hypothetical protein